MRNDKPEPMLDLVAAAARIGMTRERLLRKVLLREVRGERVNGRWFCSVADVERLAGERPGSADPQTDRRRTPQPVNP